MRATEDVVAALAGFAPSAADEETVLRLRVLLGGLRNLPHCEEAISAMFALLERFPESNFGMPGPIVHETEAIGGYASLLRASLARQPTDLTVWMVNRLLNSALPNPERAGWLAELRRAAEHPKSPKHVSQAALSFLAHQAQRA